MRRTCSQFVPACWLRAPLGLKVCAAKCFMKAPRAVKTGALEERKCRKASDVEPRWISTAERSLFTHMRLAKQVIYIYGLGVMGEIGSEFARVRLEHLRCLMWVSFQPFFFLRTKFVFDCIILSHHSSISPSWICGIMASVSLLHAQ